MPVNWDLPRGTNPCPFCRGERLGSCDVDGHRPTERRFWIWCGDCGASGPNAETAVAALGLWNTRAVVATMVGGRRKK